MNTWKDEEQNGKNGRIQRRSQHFICEWVVKEVTERRGIRTTFRPGTKVNRTLPRAVIT